MLMLKYYSSGGGCKMSKYNPDGEYKVIRLLGTGGSGKVYLVINREGNYFAEKIISQELKYKSLIQSEISFMKLLNNPFILNYYESLPTKTRPANISDIPKNSVEMERIKKARERGPNAESRQLDRILKTMSDRIMFRLILEYCQGGDLLEYVKHNYLELTEDDFKSIFYQILQGIKYLHDKGIIHRDIKPENILLKFGDDINCLKIADFGLAKYYNVNNCCSEFVGTSNYIAPEVFSANDDEGDHLHKYNEKCDMWSIGIMLFILYFSEIPFDNAFLKKNRKNKTAIPNLDTFLYRHFNLDKLEKNLRHAPSDISRLIRGLLKFNQEERWTAQMCLEDPWFQDYDTSIHERCFQQARQDREMICDEGEGESSV